MRYREVGLLAEGGMAIVAQGIADDGSAVVVKRVRPPFCFDPAFLRLFDDEGAVHAVLSEENHEHIVRLLDRGEDEAGPFLVFEHVDGCDLARIQDHAIGEGRVLEVEGVLAVFIPLMKALAAAHEAKSKDGQPLHLVHRDVSPGNVLVGLDGCVKLADFGVASSTLKTEVTVAGEMKGKFAYMAPEQTRGDRVTAQTDLFSAGIVLWECLSGKKLFDGPTDADVVHAVRTQEAPRLEDPRLPRGLGAIVARLLEKDPAARPASARAVAQELADVALELGLDEGLQRHAARLARQTPKADVRMRDMDARRRTQRVVGQDAGAVVVRAPSRGRWPAIAGVAAAAVLVIAGSAAINARSTPETVEHLPDPVPSAVEPVIAAVGPVTPPVAPLTPPVALVTPAVTPVTRSPPPSDDSVKAVKAAKREVPKPEKKREGFGLLSVDSEPWASVTVDGELVDKETPMHKFRLPAGEHVLVLENHVLHLTKTLRVTVEPDQEAKRFVDLNAP